MTAVSRARTALGIVMGSNAALFFFGAIQHAGIALGPFHEPRILAAAIVETVCGWSLVAGAAAIFRGLPGGWRMALAANLVALAGVLLGVAALAVGAGPRTASNDSTHRIMLALTGACLLIVFMQKFLPRMRSNRMMRSNRIM